MLNVELLALLHSWRLRARRAAGSARACWRDPATAACTCSGSSRTSRATAAASSPPCTRTQPPLNSSAQEAGGRSHLCLRVVRSAHIRRTSWWNSSCVLRACAGRSGRGCHQATRRTLSRGLSVRASNEDRTRTQTVVIMYRSDARDQLDVCVCARRGGARFRRRGGGRSRLPSACPSTATAHNTPLKTTARHNLPQHNQPRP